MFSIRKRLSASVLGRLTEASTSSHMLRRSALRKNSGLCFECESQLVHKHARAKQAIQKRHLSSSSAPRFAVDPENMASLTMEDFADSQSTHPLSYLFNPRNVAVIGASEKQGSVGRIILQNLISSPFGGTVFPVNIARKSILGIVAYPNIKDVAKMTAIDLVVICIPAKDVPQAIQDSVDAGVKGAIIISAGFAEAGELGQSWLKQIQTIARRGNLRIIGPNCLGLMSPMIGLNATFAHTVALPGKVAVVSQSGALATAILDYALREHVGFSAFVSIGSMGDVSFADLIDYLGRDPKTESIVLYMESIGDARSFINAARTVALTKPIIVIKVGRTAAGGKAASSHTGTLVGSDDVLDAAVKRCGILRVDTIQELFYMAQTLAKQPRPKGNRLNIVTNAGGPAAICVDSLYSSGGQVAQLSPDTVQALNKILPEHWSHSNPVDILGDAPPKRYADTLDIVSNDNNSDASLVILTPQAMSDPTATADVIRQFNDRHDKTLLACWMGGNIVAEGKRLLAKSGIPVFAFPDVAAKVFNFMWKYSDNLQTLYEIPDLSKISQVSQTNKQLARQLVKQVRDSGRVLLTEYESKILLQLYGFPVTEMIIANTAEEAVAAATKIGYPVCLKLHSETITHKSDVDGVSLNLHDANSVREAFYRISTRVPSLDFHGVNVQQMVKLDDSFEVILGSSTDSQLGKTIVFGHGGKMVEVFKDTVIGLPPLTSVLARNMITSTKIYKALAGFRGKAPVKMDLLESLLMRFSQMITDLNASISEIDINPLVISPTGAVALDARVVLYPKFIQESDVVRLAFREYPTQYAWNVLVTDPDKQNQDKLRVRIIRAEDHHSLVSFFQRLSTDASMSAAHKETALKYIHAMSKIANLNKDKTLETDKKLPMFNDSKKLWDLFVRLCIGNYDQQITLIAETVTDQHAIHALAMYTRSLQNPALADIALVVDEKFQQRKLGSMLMERLTKIAKDEGVETLTATISKNNKGMQRLVHNAGFSLVANTEEDSVLAVLRTSHTTMSN